MMRDCSGIVLDRRKEGEGDAVVTLLLESGETLRVRVHGIMISRNRSRLVTEPGTLVRAVVYEKEERASLKEGTVLDRYEEIKTGYGEMLLLTHLLELAGFVYGAQEGGEELYRLVSGSLDTLRNRKRESPFGSDWMERFLLFYRIRILKLAGMVGDMLECSSCGSPLEGRARVESRQLSALCHNCDSGADETGYAMAEFLQGAIRMRFGRWMEYFLPKSSEELVRSCSELVLQILESEFPRFRVTQTQLKQYLESGGAES